MQTLKYSIFAYFATPSCYTHNCRSTAHVISLLLNREVDAAFVCLPVAVCIYTVQGVTHLDSIDGRSSEHLPGYVSSISASPCFVSADFRLMDPAVFAPPT